MRLGFLLVLLPIVSPHLAHAADDYQIAIAPKGSAIELTFTNQTKGKIHIPTYVATDGRHYDWLACTTRPPSTTRGMDGSRRRST